MELLVVTRKTSPALLEGAVRLEKRIFPKHESMAESLGKEALKTQNTLMLAVESQTRAVIGYALYRRNGLNGFVDKVAVAEQSRRSGVGRALLHSAIAQLQANRAVTVGLVVDVERKGAIALYESAGFRVQSTREDYYQPGRHALVMQRSLLLG